jgi:hypothetical protein
LGMDLSQAETSLRTGRDGTDVQAGMAQEEAQQLPARVSRRSRYRCS